MTAAEVGTNKFDDANSMTKSVLMIAVFMVVLLVGGEGGYVKKIMWALLFHRKRRRQRKGEKG